MGSPTLFFSRGQAVDHADSYTQNLQTAILGMADKDRCNPAGTALKIAVQGIAIEGNPFQGDGAIINDHRHNGAIIIVGF